MTSPTPNDPVPGLITGALRGDQAAYARLYDVCAPGVYRLCYGLLLHAQDAEDVLQDSFVYAFRNLSRYDASRASFKTWLYTIAVSRCRNVHRRQRPTTVDMTQNGEWDVPAPQYDSPEAVSAHQAATEVIERALTQLSAPLREAVVLRYKGGLTFREMSEILGIPLKTAESRVRLAHDKLRGLLTETGRGLLEELLPYEG